MERLTSFTRLDTATQLGVLGFVLALGQAVISVARWAVKRYAPPLAVRLVPEPVADAPYCDGLTVFLENRTAYSVTVRRVFLEIRSGDMAFLVSEPFSVPAHDAISETARASWLRQLGLTLKQAFRANAVLSNGRTVRSQWRYFAPASFYDHETSSTDR
jgi:hypothetical protein